MNLKIKPNFVLLLIALLFITSITIIAQPKKDRGVKNQTSSSQNEQTLNNSSTQNNKKRLVVILDFDDGTNTVDAQKRPVGRQVAIMLADEFTRAGNFTIIEREKIEEVLTAQNKTFGNRFDPQTAAKIGKVLSAQIVVLGTVIEYTTKRVTKGLPGFKKVTLSAKVGATIRLVDVNTGVVLDSVTVNGDSKDVSTATVFTSEDTDLTDEVKTSLLTAAAGDAAKKAEDQLTKLLDKTLGQPSPKPETEPSIKKEQTPTPTGPTKNTPMPSSLSNAPRIAVIDGQDVYVKNLPQGTKIGTRLIAFEIGKSIKDPETGEILKQEEKIIGELEIVSIANNSFVCKIISGTGLTSKTLIKLK